MGNIKNIMENKENFNKMYRNLPQKTRELIVSEELHDEINLILTFYKLKENDAKSIEETIINQVVGMENKNDIKEKLSKLSLVDDVKHKIFDDITNKILTKLDEIYLKSLNNIKIEIEKNGDSFDVDDYIKNIEESNSVKNEKGKFVDNEDVRKRLSEISFKYGLDEKQKNDLLNLLKSEDDESSLNEAIIKNLGLSAFISEQIVDDLNKRVFEYALNFTEKKDTPKIVEKKPEIKKEIKIEVPVRVETPVVNKQIPEIRPENLPEVAGSVKVNTVQDKPKEFIPNPIKPVVSEQKTEDSPSRIIYKSVNGGEVVQRAGSVPRFNAVPLDEPVLNTVKLTENMPEVTKPENPAPALQKPEVKVEAPKKYVTDPYREPLN